MTKNIILLISTLSLFLNNLMAQEIPKEELSRIDFHLKNSSYIEISYFDTLLNRFPNNLYLTSMKMLVMLDCEMINESEILINSLTENQKTDTYILTAIGVYYFKTNQLKQAYKFLHSAKKADTEKQNKWARLELFNLLKENNYEEAWAFLEEALEIDSEFTPALIAYSYELDLIDNCEEIISILNNVIRNHKDADVYRYLGNAYLNCNNIEKAKEFILKSIEMEETADGYSLLAYIEHFHYNNSEQAIHLYEKSLSIDDKPDIKQELAWLFIDIGEKKKAEEIVLENYASEKDPFYIVQAFLFYITFENYERAEQILNDFFNKNGKDFQTDGMSIILTYKKNNLTNKQLFKLLDNYSLDYDEADTRWLIEILDGMQNKF
jgi:tetratricopeptide (TPR) repeat protein